MSETPELTPVPVQVTTTQTTKRKRLALDLIGQLEDDLKDDPLNYNKWLELIKLIERKDKAEQVRSTYEKFLSYFPFDGSQWIGYVNYESARGEFSKVEEIYGRCLTKVYDVELCRSYISYVRRVNNIVTGGEQARGVILQAFDFTIAHVGIDINSGALWDDYLTFISSWNPVNTWEKQQKSDYIRNVYRKCVVLPINNLESLWSSYSGFENDLNTTTARKFLSEKSAEYMTARSWYREFSNLTEGLNRNIDVSNNSRDKFQDEYLKQIKLWKYWIKFEKANKMSLSDELLQKRIEYAYRQALKTLKFYPEFWFDFSKYWLDISDQVYLAAATELLNEGIVINPSSFSLTFQLAELHEKEGEVDKIGETYNKLIKHLTGDYAKLKSQVSEIKAEDEQTRETKEKIKSVEDVITTLSNSITLVYSKYMTAMKRCKGLKESRDVFKEARAFENIQPQIFTDNALMEHHNGKPKVAVKIFESGLRKFSDNGEFISQYLDYLIMINDDSSFRVKFEHGITALKGVYSTDEANMTDSPNAANSKIQKPENAKHIKKLFKKFLKYESVFGDLNAVKVLERRYFEFFPNDNELLLFSDRYREDSIDAIKQYDLGGMYLTHLKPANNFEEEEEEDEPVLKKIKLSNGEDSEDDSDEDQVDASTFVTDEIYNLLRILPNESYFPEPIFNPTRLVQALRDLP